MRSEKLQFSIANLLGWAGVCAVLLALAKIHFLWVPIACPFLLGPMTAITVTPTRWAMFLGVMSSLYWSMVGVVPYWFLGKFLFLTMSYMGDGSVDRSVLTIVTAAYFFLVSAIGGYKGGLAARPD